MQQDMSGIHYFVRCGIHYEITPHTTLPQNVEYNDSDVYQDDGCYYYSVGLYLRMQAVGGI